MRMNKRIYRQGRGIILNGQFGQVFARTVLASFARTTNEELPMWNFISGKEKMIYQIKKLGFRL